jgi:predicted lipoprotein
MRIILIFLILFKCKNSNLNEATNQNAVLSRFVYNQRGYDYPRLINSLLRNVILPSFNDVQVNSENLFKLTSEFKSNQNLSNFIAMRNAYQTLKDSIERVEVYGFNTTTISLNLFTNIDMYPGFSLDTTKIENEEILGTNTLNLARIQNLTISKRTILAIEYFLYDNSLSNNDSNLNLSSLQANQRRVDYLVSLSEDISIRAKSLNDTWKNSFANEYATGTVSFTSLNDVIGKQVNFMNDILTSFIDNKIGDPAGLSAKSRGIIDLNRLESKFSNRSLEDIEKNFASVKNLYTGNFKNQTEVFGISHLVGTINPRLDTKIRSEFQRIDSQIISIRTNSVNLRQAIQTRYTSVQELHSSFKNLRVIFQTELFSSLGTTFQIGNADGD